MLRVAYPRYDEDSSAMVRHYLAGDFGEDPDVVSPRRGDVLPPIAMPPYRQEVGRLAGGGLVIADRHTTANMLHQVGKIRRRGRPFSTGWRIMNFGSLGAAPPDAVIYLDMPLKPARRSWPAAPIK